MMRVTRTTCPYCGVGCGVVAEVAANGSVTISGDPAHPANRGWLCSKGAALADTLAPEGRLLHPQIDGRQVDWDTALDTVADGFRRTLAQHGPDSVAFYLSGQLLTEDYYVANKLMKGFIGSANVDTNSRLCMASAVTGYKRAFGADVVPCSYQDVERAKLVVLVGSNAAWTHPVLYRRLARTKELNPDLQVVVIDPRRTATCDIADRHLALTPASDGVLFAGLLAYLADQDEVDRGFVDSHTDGVDEALGSARSAAGSPAAVARACGLAEAEVLAFYRLFARTERTVTLFSQGINQSSSGSDKANAIINCHLLTGRIGRPGMGPFSLTGQPNAMGGREVGGLANQLAAHMALEDADARARVQAFWRSPSIASRPGPKAVDLFRAVEAGRIKAIWIMGTNPAVSLPEADRVREALRRCPLVVVSDCVAASDTVDLAHIRLPALAWGEKAGSVTNSERCISRQRTFRSPPGSARADWRIVSEVAKRMGFAEGFDYDGPAAIFSEHAALSAHGNGGARAFDIGALAGLSQEGYDRLEPVQWPAPRDARTGTVRLFGDGRFFTANGRARFVPVTPRQPASIPTSDYPLVLNSGRLRDQWHTMTRTGGSARLASHTPEPCVEVAPADAAQNGLEEGAFAEVASAHGSLLVRVRVSADQPPGSVFVPIHWSDTWAARARVGALYGSATDPDSGQPESKFIPVSVRPRPMCWQASLISRRRLTMEADYWAVRRGRDCWVYTLAGRRPADDWPAWARATFRSPSSDEDWIEYRDRDAYRAARVVSGILDSCLFVQVGGPAPDPAWLEGLFAAAPLSERQRAGLLCGRPPADAPSGGRTVCACHGVDQRTLERAVRDDGADSVARLGELTRAGTGCGACKPELHSLLQAVAPGQECPKTVSCHGS